MESEPQEQAIPTDALYFEFVVHADGREVRHGQELDANYAELRRQCLDAQLTISWRAKPFTLV